MPGWLAIALALVAGAVVLAALCEPGQLRAGWARARARRAALRQLDRDGWHRP